MLLFAREILFMKTTISDNKNFYIAVYPRMFPITARNHFIKYKVRCIIVLVITVTWKMNTCSLRNADSQINWLISFYMINVIFYITVF